MEIYIEHADGYTWITEAEDIEEATQIIENEAIAVYENCFEADVADVFPLYWSIKNKKKEIICSGYVNENGELIS
jgi:hypothetical protein